jgi:hypothetical protein
MFGFEYDTELLNTRRRCYIMIERGWTLARSAPVQHAVVPSLTYTEDKAHRWANRSRETRNGKRIAFNEHCHLRMSLDVLCVALSAIGLATTSLERLES